MAKGNVSGAVAIIEAKKRGITELGERQRKLYFKLEDGESATVRFLDEELHWAWVHQLPATGEFSWGRKVPCRDQDENGEPVGERCPGCERGDRRSFQGAVNLIWRDAPVIERDENNRLIRDTSGRAAISGRADGVAVWVAGITVFEELDDLSERYGLSSRDFIVKRKGTKLNTRYSIMPADDGAKKMTKKDTELAEQTYDLSEFVTAPTYENWGKTYQPEPVTTSSNFTSDSPFRRTR